MPTDPLEMLVRGVERIEQRLDEQAKVLERNTVSLEYHIRRTDELESFTRAQTKTSERRFKVLEVSRERMLGALKLFSVISTVAGGVFAALRLLKLV